MPPVCPAEVNLEDKAFYLFNSKGFTHYIRHLPRAWHFNGKLHPCAGCQLWKILHAN